MWRLVPAALALAALLIAGPSALAQNDAPASPPNAAPPTGPVASGPAAAVAPQAAPAPETGPVTAVQSPPRAAKAAPPPRPTPPPAPRAPAGARLQADQALPPGELAAFVDGVVQAAMAREHIAGVTVAVVQNGQVLLKKGYGFATLAPNRPVDPDRTLFRLGSASQAFTWIALLKQGEAGRIRLDQPVNLYLPERVQVRDQGFERPVRVIDLMDQAGGFEDRAFGRLIEQDPDFVRPLELYLRQERPRRVRPPGETASYSSYGAGLAGEALAWTSGKPFERLMEEELFLPLGMSRTTFREKRPPKAGLPAPMPAGLAADAAEGFHWTGDGFQPRPYEHLGQIAPAGAASSTAGDMARFMLALLGGGQLDGAAVYGPLTANALRTPILATPGGINGWAHGFMVDTLPGGFTGYGQDGGSVSFAANLVTVPHLNLGVFVAANSDTGARLVEALPEAVVREFYAASRPFPRAAAPELAGQADLFAGRYRTTRRAYAGLEGFVGSILGTVRVRVTPDGRLVTTGPDAKAWTLDGPAGAGRFVALQGEERLVFRMAGGGASAYRRGRNLELFERISFWRSPDALAAFATLAAVAAALTLAGAAARSRREARENAVQSRAALVQNIQGGLWLLALAAFGLWSRSLSDPARLMFAWPAPLLVTASACALVAALLTISTIVALPAVWRGGRRVDSWPIQRRAAFTVTVLVYAVFAVLLARAGALSPWR